MRVLIFGTTYVDTPDKFRLLEQWVLLHKHINPECDLCLVDSASPMYLGMEDLNRDAQILQLSDNIGHLSRHGQDGWGRAFCEGVIWAIHKDYDYVVHIEGDSLCNLPVMKICEIMQDAGALALSVPVRGTRHVEQGWVETGLMFFDVEFLAENNFIDVYNWRDGASKKYPHTPEAVVHDILADELEMMPWRNMRDDMKILNTDNVHEYHWISHATPEVYDAFVASALEHA